jgi:uncharacterized membrane protein
MQTERAITSGGEQALQRQGGGGALVRGADGTQRTRRRAIDLGWFSVGLGLTQLLSPGFLGRAIGVGDDPRTRLTMRLLGARELAAGIGLLSRRSDPVFLWARVAGDLMDLALLGKAMATPSNRRERVASATAAVVGATALDAYAAVQATRARRAGGDAQIDGRSLRDAVHATHSITVACPIEEVRRAWQSSPVVAALRETGRVDIHAAPGNQGTEICVELRGPVPSVAREMFGSAFSTGPGRGVAADLRRFKQVLEVGEIVHSTASIHARPHAARPSADDGRLVAR